MRAAEGKPFAIFWKFSWSLGAADNLSLWGTGSGKGSTGHLLSQIFSLTLCPRPFIRGNAALMGPEHSCHAAALSYFIPEVTHDKHHCR